MEEFFDYVAEKQAAMKQEAERLKTSDRIAEANLAKVKANIYELCCTVCKVHLNRPGGGIDACRKVLDQFQTVWSAERDKAAAHEDVYNTVIGNTKLEALQDARAKLEEVNQ